MKGYEVSNVAYVDLFVEAKV